MIATFCPAYLHPTRRDLSDALEVMDEAWGARRSVGSPLAPKAVIGTEGTIINELVRFGRAGVGRSAPPVGR